MSGIISTETIPMHSAVPENDYFSQIHQELLPNIFRFLNFDGAKCLSLTNRRLNALYFAGLREILKEMTRQPEIFDKFMKNIIHYHSHRHSPQLREILRRLDVHNLSRLIGLGDNYDYPSNSLVINMDQIDALLNDPEAFSKTVESMKNSGITSIFLYSSQEDLFSFREAAERDVLRQKMGALTPLLHQIAPSISDIKLINVPLNDEEFTSLLEKCPSLEHLSIAYTREADIFCQLTQAGLAEIELHPDLKSLDLVGFGLHMNQKTLEEITHACRKLQSLNLRGLTLISSEAFISIADCTSLKSLNLSHTNINGETLERICAECKDLRILDISGVSEVSEPGDTIVDCLTFGKSCNLEELTIDTGIINLNDCIDLHSLIKNHSNLKVLNIDFLDRKTFENLKNCFPSIQINYLWLRQGETILGRVIDACIYLADLSEIGRTALISHTQMLRSFFG